MRKFTAIILCTAFITAQYARQASYLECKLANYFNTTGEKCDCEKLSGESKGTNEPSPLPVRHNHLHIDDSYYYSSPAIHKISGINSCIPFNITQTVSLKAGICPGIDHPPQFA